MWYFSWILGVLLAASFGIVNVMWLELVAGDAFGESTEPDLSESKTKFIAQQEESTDGR